MPLHHALSHPRRFPRNPKLQVSSLPLTYLWICFQLNPLRCRCPEPAVGYPSQTAVHCRAQPTAQGATVTRQLLHGAVGRRPTRVDTDVAPANTTTPTAIGGTTAATVCGTIATTACATTSTAVGGTTTAAVGGTTISAVGGTATAAVGGTATTAVCGPVGVGRQPIHDKHSSHCQVAVNCPQAEPASCRA